jgi:peptidyl-prolyl cis-trans isomerase C
MVSDAPPAWWQSGHAAACKAAYAGSIPTQASNTVSLARVAKSVDAGDLKSPGLVPCEFKSRPGHHADGRVDIVGPVIRSETRAHGVPRMSPFSRFFVLLMTACLTACGGAGGPERSLDVALVGAPDGPLVASVNGEPITEPVLNVYAGARGLDPADPTQRKQALDSLIDNVLLAQDGVATGLAARPEVQSELALVRMQQLSGRALAEHRSRLEVTDAQVEAYYRQETERAGDTQWRVEHILFAEQAPAQAAVLRALEGSDFEQLMAEYAQGQALQARSLEWGNATQLPAELVVALRQLQDGQVAPVPIETPHGWHVVRRAESRPFAPPPLEQIHAGARAQLLERAVAEHVAALRARSNIVTSGQPTP